MGAIKVPALSHPIPNSSDVQSTFGFQSPHFPEIHCHYIEEVRMPCFGGVPLKELFILLMLSCCQLV